MKSALLIFFTSWFLVISAQQEDQNLFVNLDIEVSTKPVSSINTKNLEFSPSYYANGIVYVFAREQERFIDLKIGMPFFELMYAEFGPDGMPGRSSNFSPNIRSRFHEGPVSFANNERTIYFTRSNANGGEGQTDSEGKKIHLKIFEAQKGPDDWENITELPFCDDNYSVAQPAVFSGGTKLIFSSDMPGGFGGMDLYVVEKQSGIWSQPLNLGSGINTDKNELFPFMHDNGVLFFASNGHQGLGGLDIYAAQWTGQGTTEPVNLGQPFNSRKDDLGFIIDPEGMTGFFTSARKEGKGKDDIYAFQCSSSLFRFPLSELTTGLLVTDAKSGSGIADAGIWAFEVGEKGPLGIEEYYETELIPSETQDGSLVIRLNRKRNFEEQSAHLRTGPGGKIPFQYFNDRDYLLVVQAEGYREKEILLEAEDLVQDGETPILLESLAEETSEDCVTISGTIKDEKTNEELDLASIAFENTCTDAMVVIQSGQNGKYSTCLDKNCVYQVNIDLEGYYSQSLSINVEEGSGQTIYLKRIDPGVEVKESDPILTKGVVILLENIYYDFNKSEIRKGSTEDLDALVDIMSRYPGMVIELSAHTDTRGTAEYNLELSKRRAISASDYLIARSIAPERISINPKGELEPRNHCLNGVSCTDEEHALNRRTEIKVLEIDRTIEIKYGKKRPDQIN